MIKVYSMTAIMDLSFPGQRTATATSCIPHDSVYMPGPRAGKSENGFFRCDTWLQIFQNDSKICEAEVTLTPPINKICKPCVAKVSKYGKSEYPQALNASYTFQPLMSFWLNIKDISVTVFACCRYRKIINCCLYCCLRCTFLCF